MANRYGVIEKQLKSYSEGDLYSIHQTQQELIKLNKFNNDAEKTLKEAAKKEMATIATLNIEPENEKTPTDNANIPTVDLTNINQEGNQINTSEMNGGKTTPSFHNIGKTQNNARGRTFSNQFSKETLDKTMERSKHLGQNTYAQVAQINVTEEMRTLNTGEYIKNVVEKNKLITNKPPQPRQRPKTQDPMDQIASIIGIKKVKWCDVKTHHDNNAARSSADGFEAVAKHSTYAAARVRYAALLIHATLKSMQRS